MSADDETQDVPPENELDDDEQDKPLDHAEEAHPGGYSIPPDPEDE